MIAPISQYILAVRNLDIMSRTLAGRKITPILGERGEVKCHIGNSAIIFEVMCGDRRMAMRVYMRHHPNLQAIYGENYYPKELLINSNSEQMGMADVVLCEWVEGVTLQSKIENLCQKPEKMALLAKMFEEFALSWLNERWAHGDIKPENIILSGGELRLIDFDALYREGFSTNECVEVGTRQYQHPLRDKSNFDRSIDDYPIALIVTALSAMALDKQFSKGIAESDHLLIRPELAIAGRDEMLDTIERLFAEKGDARHYRIAQLLRSPRHSLPQLKNLLQAKTLLPTPHKHLTLEYCNGYWGYAEEGRYLIPPIYDLAFEYSEGLALVRVGDVWHFIDECGAVVITCGRGSGIKSMRGGQTTIHREDGTFIIYSNGEEERI